MNLINSIWFLIAIVINIPVTLWTVNFMSPIASLFAGVNTTMYYVFQISLFVFVFVLVFIVPTNVMFGSVQNSPFGKAIKKQEVGK